MMKRILSIILSITMLLSMATVAFADGVDGPMQKAKIKVAISADFKPFEYYDENGKLTGFDVDLMNYIGEKIGFDIEFVDMSFDKLIPAVVNEEVTCAISAITATDERDSVVDFTKPYFMVMMVDGNYEDVEEFSIAVSKGKSELLKQINESIISAENDGTISKIAKKYKLTEVDIDDEAYFLPIFEKSDENGKYGENSMSDGTPLAPPSDWALSDVEKAEALNITSDEKIYRYRMSITREEFCELVYNLIDSSGRMKNVPTNNPFADTNNAKIYALYSIGVINGKGATEFAPSDLLTREEAATIIIRMINKVMPMAVTEMWFEYDDINEISEWASDSIQVISNLGIMKGVGNNRFAPQDTYTTEQAIVTLVRVYEKAEAAGIIGVDNDAIIGGADGPTDIVVVETVKIKDISTGEEKNLSADDSKAILDILAESNDWTEGTADCLNDCEIKIGDRTIMYHSGCGTFNDNKNMKSISLDEKVKPYINSILEKYIQLGNDETKE